MTDQLRRPIHVATAVADSVCRLPGVIALHGGTVGEFATYGDGTRVAGVRATDRPIRSIEIRVVARFGVELHELARQVRAAAASRTRTTAWEEARIDVRIVDLDVAQVEPDEGRVPGTQP
jgi:uncharacterized alkaline shock family protein YloU